VDVDRTMIDGPVAALISHSTPCMDATSVAFFAVADPPRLVGDADCDRESASSQIREGPRAIDPPNEWRQGDER
jgi:hypothetical protein